MDLNEEKVVRQLGKAAKAAVLMAQCWQDPASLPQDIVDALSAAYTAAEDLLGEELPLDNCLVCGDPLAFPQFATQGYCADCGEIEG